MHQLSVWEKETFFSHQDIIIVGSGFTGLWSAFFLIQKNPNYKITILERGIIPTGASTRNAGFSCFGSPSELVSDAAIMGDDKMWELVAMRYKGLDEIRKHFSGIDYVADGGYECFTGDTAIWNNCFAKLDWLNEGLENITGERNLFTIADQKLAEFGFDNFDHLIENKLEGGLHPAKLIQALLKHIQQLGVQVLTSIDVLKVEEDGKHVQVFTNRDIVFSSNQVLLCTNAFTKSLIPDADIIPNRGQVLITNPIKNLPFKGTFHFDKGYYYFRNLDNRVLLGGARNTAFDEENTTTMESTPAIQQKLEAFISSYILPGKSFTIEDRWSGIMAMGSQKYPIVKSISKNVFCCVRMNGIGVALAPIVAKEVTELMSQAR